ncbi:MoaD/ThiS family protein [Metallumcola ferriviriculae]|uniref:MoaD/ThiS family protein n=1 Tax=Metallumcola ferriviriculae TaxID=3039180 RepID=A0AAU0UP65_9FIRM|nr:MoaD/ThiS family protein [Desulfitibacteraceae bacterium MK1]
MEVTIKLFANLREKAPECARNGQWVMEIGGQDRVVDILQKYDLVLATDKMLVTVNGQVLKENYQLQEGDEICVFPPLIGG